MTEAGQHVLEHLHPGKQRHFGVLLTTLVVLFVGESLMDYIGEWIPVAAQQAISIILFVAVLTSAVTNVIQGNSSKANLIRLLVIATVITRILAAVFEGTGLEVLSLVMAGISLSYTIVLVTGYLLRARRADGHVISAGICVFLLMGVTWAILYSLIEILEPGSFSFPPSDIEDIQLGVFSSGHTSSTFYFSFVTLTTLGYGDITPVSTAARGFATLEALTGQIYLVVLVARLVGLSITERTEDA